ncbi:MAG: 2-amino-4-hydroxy-6-hydroxymethyldihydropteridine diphosphokinase [Planctomycetota bacterium]
MSSTRQPERLVFAAIGLGSNLGVREAHIEAGFTEIAALARTSLIGRSTVIETEPVGPAGQGPYLNAAALVATRLSARGLLDGLIAIETGRGRDRSVEERWGPRTLDLDVLLYGDAVIDEPGLTVPHPRLAERAFVLTPLAEVAGDFVVPGDGRTIDALSEAVGGVRV